MTQQPNSNMPPEELAAKRKMLIINIYIISVVMSVAGLLCFFEPDMVRTVIDMDDATLKILGGCMLAMAVFDVLFFRHILKEPDSK